MKEVVDFVKKCRIFYLATVEGDQPRVRPFGVIEIYEDKVYVMTGKGKNVFKQIDANHKVELCAATDTQWVRISGNLINDDRVEAKKFILDTNPYLRNMYNENDDNTAVLYFEDATAVMSSFTAAPREIKL